MHIVALLLIVAIVAAGAVAYHRRGVNRRDVPFG